MILAEDLEITEAEDGCVVYDRSSDLVHHLNQTAAMVLHLCDGTQTAPEICALLGGMFADQPGAAEAIAGCLIRLGELGLIRHAEATEVVTHRPP